MEQRVNLKFLVKLRENHFRSLCNAKRSEGHEATQNDPRPGRPSTSKTDENIEKIGKLIREDLSVV
ncbi:hypothetical protein NQ318_000620 [Aromia moschata]|uniref:Uncharacterized protein n=1 Tax=Aromia moschata TaxID=1265417 RepID=A0AAV8WZB9_9CUCU|nr:hypothetical protein NQ318_000620 [Aromia moschata]